MNIRIIKACQTWSLRHSVMWPHKSLEYVKVPNDEHGLHYGLFLDDDDDKSESPISVVSLFVEHQEAQFRKFCTDTRYQGKGYGTCLLQHMMKEIDANNSRQQQQQQQVDKIWCNARKDKTSFYEKFGMKTTCKEFQKGGIDYVIMELEVHALNPN